MNPLSKISLLLFSFLYLSCGKNSSYSDIPNVQVDLFIPLSLPEYSALNGVGNSVKVAGGYKGILIFRKSIDQFAAYERACSFDPTNSGALVDVDSSLVLGIDRHCGSKFNFFDGSVVNGPASRPLKQYNCDYDAQLLTLHIYN
jgi:nitrite reductase/ring-hydroxylating ferredoxin subunit